MDQWLETNLKRRVNDSSAATTTVKLIDIFSACFPPVSSSLLYRRGDKNTQSADDIFRGTGLGTQFYVIRIGL